MRAIIGIISVMFSFMHTSCSKSYTCECQNPGGSEDVFTTYSKRSAAEKKCDDYYQEHYGNIPMNETHCHIK